MIYGNGKLKGGTVDSFNDHRIAMAAAVATCICDAPVSIINPESVTKSFPGFFEKMKSVRNGSL
jgi:3-phosphoshikimate 1-carboxyvinyltransferase